ncbi:MAG: hypothetical protein NE334_01540 [Lentisphaeraceae bacterium]|nr:hypothetical protein [Lentisphaeraceae bacterium]
MFKLNLFAVIACALLIPTYADTKDILKRIPADYDYVLCVRFPELFKNEKLKRRIDENKQFIEAKKNVEEKLGLKEEDLLSFYIAGVAAQYQGLNKMSDLNSKKLETAAFMELGKDLNLDDLEKQFPQAFTGRQTVNGVTCIEFKADNMDQARLAFISPRTLMVCPQNQLAELTKLTIDQSMLANRSAERLLTTNGFGGILSFVHWGEIGEVHPMTPWMKNYSGGTVNIYYEEAKGLDVELTMSFNDLTSVKSASLLLGMGMSFLDMKPELSQLKQLIDFKAYDKNLMIDVKISSGMLTQLESMVKNIGKRPRGNKQ